MKNASKNIDSQANNNWIADAAGIPLIQIDIKSNTAMLNSSARKLFYIDSEKCTINKISERFIDPKDLENLLAKTDTFFSVPELTLFSDARILYYKVEVERVNENILKVLFVALNKNIEDEQEFFRQFVENSKDVFSLWTADHQLLYVGAQFEKVFERSRSELEKNPFAVMNWVHPDDTQMLLSSTRENNDADSEQFDVEFRILLPDGTPKWIWYRRKSIRDKQGVPYRYFSLISDIDPRKKAEKLLSYRHEFESFLFNASARFIDISPDKTDECIDQTIREVCEFTGSNDAYIYIFDEKKSVAKREHHFTNSGNTKDSLSVYYPNQNQWHYEMLRNRHFVNVNFSDPEIDMVIKKIFESNEIASFVDIGLYYRNELIGFFGLASGSKQKIWSEDEIKLLQILGDIFINAVIRKESDLNLYKSEQTYLEIYNSSTDAIFIHDAETGQVVDVNQAMLDMYEVSYDEALKSSAKDFHPDPNYDDAEALKMIHAAHFGPQLFTALAKSKKGKLFWIEISLKEAEIHGEKRVIAIVRNIEERKKTEELLRQSEEKYRMIIEGQNELVVKVDLEGRFLFVSPSYCKLFNKTEEELLGNQFIPLVHEDDRESTLLAMENLAKPPHSCYIEQRAKTIKGWRWLAWGDTAVLDENDKVKEIIGVGRDITYQKMVENALRELSNIYPMLCFCSTKIPSSSTLPLHATNIWDCWSKKCWARILSIWFIPTTNTWQKKVSTY
jgi:PAS domain S-box-containing protein